MNMLDHLLDPTRADLVLEVEKDVRLPRFGQNPAPLPLRDELGAKKKTADLIAAWEEEEAPEKAMQAARDVFAGKKDLQTLNTPLQIQKINALLNTYDVAIIEDSRRIRNYVINRLVEESDNPDPRVRLKAVELLGKVTEVAAFTERTEIRASNTTEEELNAAIEERLKALARQIAPGAAEPAEDARLLGQSGNK